MKLWHEIENEKSYAAYKETGRDEWSEFVTQPASF